MVRELGAGVRIGRFEIVKLLGAGGMGAVYEARDPELARSVALKLIHEPDARKSVRLLREAQALAQLQHPNVVGVYEVGTDGDEVFIAMELVAGTSLDRLRPRPSSWREVVAMFAQAGRGLAVAHDKGLVHRDVKPSNLLIDRSGRVRVGDFGLARLADEMAGVPIEPPIDATAATVDLVSADPGAATPRPPGDLLGSPLTGAGALVGTPKYMAPELFDGQPATTCSDQYSFCVALRELLPAGAPGWLVRAVERGTARDPAARHPSMAALVSILEHTPGRRRRVGVAAGALVILSGAAIAGAMLTRGPSTAIRCDTAGDDYATVWNQDARDRIAQAFAPARPHGADSARRAATRIDAYGARWKAARIDACRATHEKGDQSPELLDRRMHCLDHALDEVRMVVGVLAVADAEIVDRAIDTVGGLPSPERCGKQLASVMPDPDDPRAEAIRRDQITAKELYLKGQLPEARRVAADLRDRADALGHPRIRAQVLLRYVRLQEAAVEPEVIAGALEQALGDAIRAGDRDTETEALIWMLRRASLRTDAKAVEAVLPIAAAAAAREDVSDNVREFFAFNEAEAYRALGRTEQALAACDRLAAIEEAPGSDAKDCRCNNLTQAMMVEPAAAACREAVEANEQEYGPEHHYTAGSLISLASVETQRGRHEEALELVLRAAAILEAAFGPESPWVLATQSQLGSIYAALHRYDEARAAIERSLAVRRRAGEPTRELAVDLMLLSEVRIAAGEVDEGLRQLDDALRVHEQVVGAAHPAHVEMVAYGGELYYGARRWDGAARAYARCAELAREVLGEDHMVHGGCLGARAASLVELGRPREALPLAERAIAILTAVETNPLHLATARFARGRALASAGRSREGITELEAAIAIYRSAGDLENADLVKAEKIVAGLR